MTQHNNSAVQGYVFESVAEPDTDLGQRNGNVCQILRRAEVGENVNNQEVLDLGPAFIVAFDDGESIVAYSAELNPWYPT